MRKPASKEPNPPTAAEGAVAEAARRLDLALQRLETRRGAGPLGVAAEDAERLASERVEEGRRAWEQEKAALSDQLRRAREREQALQEVASLASDAIGRATAEVRAALGNDEPPRSAQDGDAQDMHEPETAAADKEEAA